MPKTTDAKKRAGTTESTEDENSDGQELQTVKGTLSKWTNYIHGWQQRYFELQDGVLVYYKSEYDTSFGCRGPLADSTGVDFKGEALTFKSTTSAILVTLEHCIDIMQQREDTWRKRLEKEMERRKRIDDQYKQCSAEVRKLCSQQKPVNFNGPDYEEGPHSALNEEEWHDAVDAALEKIDQEDDR
uniref:PH domain-containing protein n=1 Tax=Plectus sambesii TaxID=2011161 RepID=A0A914X4L5_9BILA